MTAINRMLTLSGKNPQQELLDKLAVDRKRIDESYDVTIKRVKGGYQLDEGIFSALKLAFGTASQLSKMGAEKAKQKAQELSASVKKVYKSARAKAELKNLIAGLKKIISEFEDMADDSSTILAADAEVKRELNLFKDVFINTINTLASRMAVSEGLDGDEDTLKYMLTELGILTEEPITLQEALASEVMVQLKNLPEFKEAEKRMKFISSRVQLKNGTLVFDTGMHGLNSKGEEDPKSVYLLKIYADGQVRGELKGYRMKYSNEMGSFSSHYRLGKPVVGKTEIDMYTKALVDVVKRYEKKKARYGREKEIIAKRYDEWMNVWKNANIGTDAEEEEI